MKKIFILVTIYALAFCSDVSKKNMNDKMKILPALFFLNQQSSTQNVTQSISLNLSLIGPDGKPMTVGSTSIKNTSSLNSTTSSSSVTSSTLSRSIGATGSDTSGSEFAEVNDGLATSEKAGGEDFQLATGSTPQLIEITDSEGEYAGTVAITPRTGDETFTNSFFSFSLASDTDLAAKAVLGNVQDGLIQVSVPFQDLTKLRAIFTHDGGSVKIGSTEQISGVTVNDFSSGSLTYTVVAKDGTEKTYTVSVELNQYSCNLAGIYFTDYPLVGLDKKSDATSVWYEATLPSSTNLASLKTSFSAYGNAVKVGATTQTSGQTANDFTSSVNFTVTGTNGCSENYTVKAAKEDLAPGERSTQKSTRGILNLYNFPQITKVEVIGIPKTSSFIELNASGFFDDVTGTYTTTTGSIALNVPYGTTFQKVQLGIETTGGPKEIQVNGSVYKKGSSLVDFAQRNGSNKYTADVIMIDKHSAFTIPYKIEIIMSPPPANIAVSKDSIFKLFVNSNTAKTKDGDTVLKNLISYFGISNNSVKDLKAAIKNANTAKISIARWTVDPGKIELNILGQGFQYFDYNVDKYEQDIKCFNYPKAASDRAKSETFFFLRRDADTILRSLHRAHCDQTAYPYPNYVKEYPLLVSYGKVSQNIKAVSGYGLKDLKPTNYDGDPAYFYIDFTSLEDKIDQNLETIAMDVNVQASTALNIWGSRYTLPALNYIKRMVPETGTKGTEVTIDFAAPISVERYGISCSMDGKVVLNQTLIKSTDNKNYIKAMFNVPDISKSSKVTCSRAVIPGKTGNGFQMMSIQTFLMTPYTALSGFSYPASAYTITLFQSADSSIIPSIKTGNGSFRITNPVFNPSPQTIGQWKPHLNRVTSLPYGLSLNPKTGQIVGTAGSFFPPTEIEVTATDGFTKLTQKITLSSKFPVVIPAPSLQYSLTSYSVPMGKKFSIAPSTKPGIGAKYKIDKPLPLGIGFDTETGVISGYPTSESSAVSYKVTTFNKTGTASFTFTLAFSVNLTATAPTLSFAGTSFSLAKGQPFTLSPTVSGSQPFKFSAVGLPKGLLIDSDTGIISGTPSEITSSEVIVKLSNFASTVQSTLRFTVTDIPPSFTIGGTVSGFSGGTLILQNNAGDSKTITADGAYTFSNTISSGASYSVTVQSTPGGISCSISNGSGIANTNVVNVNVTCTTLASPYNSCITTSTTSFGSAAVGDLVKITLAEYNCMKAFGGVSTVGYTGAISNSWSSSLAANLTFSYRGGTVDSTIQTYPQNHYPIALSMVPSASGAFTYQLKREFSSTLTNFTSLYSGTASSNMDRHYFAIKFPVVQATSATDYIAHFGNPALTGEATANGPDYKHVTGNVTGFQTFTNATGAISQTPGIQVLTTGSKAW